MLRPGGSNSTCCAGSWVADRRGGPLASGSGPASLMSWKKAETVSWSSLKPTIRPGRTLRPREVRHQAAGTGSRRWPGLIRSAMPSTNRQATSCSPRSRLENPRQSFRSRFPISGTAVRERRREPFPSRNASSNSRTLKPFANGSAASLCSRSVFPFRSERVRERNGSSPPATRCPGSTNCCPGSSATTPGIADLGVQPESKNEPAVNPNSGMESK